MRGERDGPLNRSADNVANAHPLLNVPSVDSNCHPPLPGCIRNPLKIMHGTVNQDEPRIEKGFLEVLEVVTAPEPWDVLKANRNGLCDLENL